MQHGLTMDIVCTGRMILWEFGNAIGEAKDDPKAGISARFLSRTMRQVEATDLLVRAEFVSDAWSLYRSLLERYFLFVHLCSTGSFHVFDDWCFKKHYEIEKRLKSSADFKDRPEVKKRRFSATQKQRYARVVSDPEVKRWRRPDPKRIAKDLRLKFLYDVGYDYASSFVHAVSTDGMSDYLRLMSRESEIEDEGSDLLLGNSQLVTVLHIQHFMNQPEYNWRKILYDLLDAFPKGTKGAECDCREILQKVQYVHASGAGLLSKTLDRA